jgi:probable F420-dependent oxidoreductase
MQLGVHGINMRGFTSPQAITTAARAAEDAGFDSLWMADHVIFPDQPGASRFDPVADALIDSVIALTWAAAVTTRLRLVTGVVILPLRNPVVLAKQLASVDVLSGGRLTFGMGVGWLEPEFEAVGADFHHRGAVADEYLEAITRLWYDDRPSFDGRFVSFDNVNTYPRPVQQPVPVVVGGSSPAAIRRTLTAGHGWYGYNTTPEAAAEHVERLRQAAGSVPRPAALGPLEITITPPPQPLTPAVVEAYAAAGVHRLVPMLPGSPADAPAVIANARQAVDAAGSLS